MPNDPKVDAPDTTDQEKPLTRTELMALLSGELGKVVNAAVTSHTKRLQKSFDERFEALTKAPKPEGEDVDAGEGAAVDPKGPKAAAGAAPQQPAPATPDPRTIALEKRVADLIKANEASAKQAATERRARIEQDGYASVARALTGKVKAGVESTVLDLLRGRNAIAIGDDGAVRLRLRTPDEPEEGLDLSDGVAAYLKTPEAGLFAPVPTTTPARRPPLQGPPGGRPNSGAQQGASDPVASFEAKHGKLSDAL